MRSSYFSFRKLFSSFTCSYCFLSRWKFLHNSNECPWDSIGTIISFHFKCDTGWCNYKKELSSYVSSIVHLQKSSSVHWCSEQEVHVPDPTQILSLSDLAVINKTKQNKIHMKKFINAWAHLETRVKRNVSVKCPAVKPNLQCGERTVLQTCEEEPSLD